MLPGKIWLGFTACAPPIVRIGCARCTNFHMPAGVGDDRGPAATYVSQLLAILVWLFAYPANKLALDGGQRRAAVS
ncbi:MAG: hypothetical protein ACI9DC_003342 [Gammaproteobacteria bacterium]|jgi:hypothetical protein